MGRTRTKRINFSVSEEEFQRWEKSTGRLISNGVVFRKVDLLKNFLNFLDRASLEEIKEFRRRFL